MKAASITQVIQEPLAGFAVGADVSKRKSIVYPP
jgi:hypothetical protein